MTGTVECRDDIVQERRMPAGRRTDGQVGTTDRERAMPIEEIVGLYRSRVYWTVRRIAQSHDAAEDITQEVFISVWQHLSRFRGESELWPWIHRIAVNAALGHLRSVRRTRRVDLDEVSHLLVSDVSTDTAVLRADQDRLLRSAADTLPPRQRTVFLMRYFAHLKYREMAPVLGRSTGTLKANYHHAVHKMVGLLQRHLAAG